MFFVNLFDLIDDYTQINMYKVKKEDESQTAEHLYTGTKFDFPFRLSYALNWPVHKVYAGSCSGICVDVVEE